MNFPIVTPIPRSARIAVLATAMICLPIGAVAQTTPPAPQRAAPAPVPARPKQAPQATEASAAAAPATQGNAAKAPGGDDVVARVGTANVSAEEMRAYIGALGAPDQAALAKDPALLSQAVRMLLANRLVMQEIVAKKWDQQPNIAAQLDRVRENALAELYLQSVSTPPAGFPSEDDLQKVYDANRAALLMPRQFLLAQIFIVAPKDADKATEDKAKKSLDEVLARLKAPGADFAVIARAVNDAKDAGDLGWVAENQIRPEIKSVVIGLAKNAVSEAIRLEDGWHVLKLLDTKAAYTRTLPEVRDQLLQQIRTERTNAMRRAYIAELLKRNPPVLNELALSNLLDSSRK